jgi:hypothetical protein
MRRTTRSLPVTTNPATLFFTIGQLVAGAAFLLGELQAALALGALALCRRGLVQQPLG